MRENPAVWMLMVVLSLVASRARAQWGVETPLTATGGNVWGLGVAASGDTVHVVYGTSDIWHRRSNDQGATWSAAQRVGSGVLHLTDAIAADGDDVWVVYLDNLQTIADWYGPREMGALWLVHSANKGATWSAPVRLTAPSTAFRVSLGYAVNRLHLVWMDYRSGAWDTYYLRSIDRGATWEPARILAQSSGLFGAERPQLAARGDSVHVTIWDDRATNPPCTVNPSSARPTTFPKCPDTFHVGSTNGGTTWGPLSNVAGGGALFAGRNDVAAAEASNVVINFNVTVPGETGTKLFVTHSSDDGASWATPVRLTFSPNDSDHGSIVGFGAGVHLVWHDDRNPSNRELYYRHSLNGGASWAPEEQVSSNAAGDSSTPLNAVTAGFLHVIWIDNRGGNYQVYYRRRALPGTGPVDGGTDAGPGVDAGSPAVDAGSLAVDAGSPGVDAGSSTMGSVESRGCNCQTRGGLLAWAALLLVTRRGGRGRG